MQYLQYQIEMVNILEQLNSWKQLNQTAEDVDVWVGIVCSMIIFVFCLIVLFIILFVHKRREPFLIATTISFGLYGALGLPHYIVSLSRPDDPPLSNILFLIASLFFVSIAHMLFTLQYLRTSLTLPLSLKEAELEWLHDKSVGQGQLTAKNIDELEEALQEFGNGSSAHDSTEQDKSTFEILRKFDEVINQIKIEVRKQNLAISLYMFFLFLSYLIAFYIFYLSQAERNTQLRESVTLTLVYVILTVCLTITLNATLFHSVNKIRKAIQNKERVFPNESLIKIHLFNFFMNSVFSIVQSSMYEIDLFMEYSVKTEKAQDLEYDLKYQKMHFSLTLMAIAQFIWDTYSTNFLIFVIYIFSQPAKEEMIHDNILNKKVSSIVFMKNQKIVQEVYKEGLTSEHQRQQNIKARAQLNNYMYYKLKKHGIVMKMDEDIGMSFMRMQVACKQASPRSASLGSEPIIMTDTGSKQSSQESLLKSQSIHRLPSLNDSQKSSLLMHKQVQKYKESLLIKHSQETEKNEKLQARPAENLCYSLNEHTKSSMVLSTK